MRVRPYKKHDFDALYAIEKRVFPDAWSQNGMENELSSAKAQYFVAEEDGNIVGYAGFWQVLDEAEIMKIAVDTSFRRRGIGGALLTAMLDEARKSGAAYIFLEVREGNRSARRLYEKHRFYSYAVREKYYSDGENAVLYKRKLEEEEV